MITLKNINKNFEKKEVLKDFNDTFSNGDVIWIKGANGCGKSTLLKIISGVMKPSSGEIIFPEKIDIGALIENPAFIEYKSLQYNLKFLYNLKNRYDEEKVRNLCDKFNLNLEDDKPIKDYSIGMRQKAGLIQAIMEDQNVILLDEPTRGLDDKSVASFNQIIKDLSREKDKIIIIAAHDGVDGIFFTRTIVLT